MRICQAPTPFSLSQLLHYYYWFFNFLINSFFVHEDSKHNFPNKQSLTHPILSSIPLFFHDHAHPLDRTFCNRPLLLDAWAAHRSDVCARDGVITALSVKSAAAALRLSVAVGEQYPRDSRKFSASISSSECVIFAQAILISRLLTTR